MEGDLRRSSSLDMMNATQVCTPAIRVALQEAPLTGTSLINIQE